MKQTSYKKYLISAFALVLLLAPVSGFAADFVPLVPVPGIDLAQIDNIGDYVNALFQLAVGIGAALAVLMIIIAGFKYMTSEAIEDFKSARSDIVRTIVGFLLLLSVWLILNVINPNLTNLEAINFNVLAPSAAEQARFEAEREANEQRRQNTKTKEASFYLTLNPTEGQREAAYEKARAAGRRCTFGVAEIKETRVDNGTFLWIPQGHIRVDTICN